VLLESGKAWQLDTLECALFAQHFDKLLLLRSGLGVSVEIHYIIEVAGPCALGQRPEFFSEGLNIVIASTSMPSSGTSE